MANEEAANEVPGATDVPFRKSLIYCQLGGELQRIFFASLGKVFPHAPELHAVPMVPTD